jgi:hypothetical protein
VLSGVCARVEGTGTGVGTYDTSTPTTMGSDFYRLNAFQGRRVATGPTTVLRFPGVPFDPPGDGTRREPGEPARTVLVDRAPSEDGSSGTHGTR